MVNNVSLIVIVGHIIPPANLAARDIHETDREFPFFHKWIASLYILPIALGKESAASHDFVNYVNNMAALTFGE